ncbi:sulfite exporter TauE/SafE family protein [Picosynechococcus sp. NKBG15041c]|uniref:sulfite exporter TauE/SafE family protein n=1 Tax=Picosynechococcus sp. NKBG15041c TaxID=1407650 RepID=UPI00040166B3|nr:sulfite exporter TauE/SafE family protein [Picosynechococcus sp. NKBG15041c]
MAFDYWFMFPVSVMIATIAMASGVEGATFFTPLFILGLGLPTDIAIGTGLITEAFGFSSGLYAYMQKGLIDYRLGRSLLLITIPIALFGTWLAQIIPTNLMKGILGVGLLAIAISFLRPEPENQIPVDQNPPETQTQLTSQAGEEFFYTIRNPLEGRLLSGIGALFLGMVSTGLGQMNGYFLIQRCRIPSKVAVATSVFIVAITAVLASIGHVMQFFQAGGDSLSTVFSLVIFTVPGVLIGAQLGSLVANYLSAKRLERGMGILFILVGSLILGEIALHHPNFTAIADNLAAVEFRKP